MSDIVNNILNNNNNLNSNVNDKTSSLFFSMTSFNNNNGKKFKITNFSTKNKSGNTNGKKK